MREEKDTNISSEIEEETTIGWTGVYLGFVQDEKTNDFDKQLKKLILLDSLRFFCEENDILTRIEEGVQENII